MTSPKGIEQRLLAAAQKANRDHDAIQAMKEYQAERNRVDANTARLRALRLAKEAAAGAAPSQPGPKKPARAATGASRSRGTA